MVRAKSPSTIVENGVRYYRNYYCHCPEGERIRYPKKAWTVLWHRYHGVPKFNTGHHARGKNHPMYGKHFSLETRKKISKGKLGKRPSLETRKKMSKIRSGKNNPNYGGKWGFKKGNTPWNEGTHYPNLGMHHTKETRDKISKSMIKFWDNKRKSG